MSDLTLRTAIVAMVKAVPGTGKVYDYERLSRDMNAFLAFFQNADAKIYGWELTRVGIEDIEHRGARYKITHAYALKGYYGLNDAAASEKSFSAIIDVIIRKFMSQTIPGAAMHTHPKAPVIENRMFGAVLCHYAELRWGVPEMCDVVDATAEGDLDYIDGNYYLEPYAGLPAAGEQAGEDLVTLKSTP